MRTFPVCGCSRHCLLLLALLVGSAMSFAPTFGGQKQNSASIQRRSEALRDVTRQQKKSTKLGMVDNLDLSLIDVQDMTVSRVAFWLCLVAAAGTAQLGRSAIPVTWDKFQAVQALAGQGSPKGGVDLELPYPEPVYEADVVEILANIENMTIPAIVQDYPIPNQLEGYLRYESLVLANPDSHPMAVRAVFDSLALGINKNQVAPRVAIQRLESYKEDLSKLKFELTKGRTIGVTALMILLALIGAADYFSLYHLFHAYFPLWPGVETFPASLLDVGKLLSLGDYYMNDVPEMPVDPSVYPV